MTTAVLVIDVQQVLCTGADVAFDIIGVIERINAVGAKARAAGAPVIFVQHEEADGSFKFGSDGWQLGSGLVTRAGDMRVRKTTPDSFNRTELHALLRARGITHLVICGLQSDFCVDTTVRRALALGYEVVLVADAHSTVDNGVLSAAQIIAHHNITLSNITSFGPRARLTLASSLGSQWPEP
jgi:nicotinamidase-related amidase